MHIRFLIVVAMGVFVFLLQCSKAPYQPTMAPVDQISLTPMENEEAELAALWLTGSLVAPVDLYERVRDDLASIRDQWGDSMAIWDDSVSEFGPQSETFDNELHFSLIGLAGFVTVYCHDTLLAMLQAGEIQTWNHLLDSLRADTMIVYSPNYMGTENRVSVGFEGRLHSKRLQEIFIDRVEGLDCCGPSFYFLRQDYAVILPDQVGEQMQYFLWCAWSNCEASCRKADLYYFKIVEDSAHLVDRWGPSYGNYEELHGDSWLQPEWVRVARGVHSAWQSGKTPAL